MSERGNLTSNEEAVRSSVMSWADALRAKDFDRLMDHYSDDIVVFDVPPPPRKTGKDRYRKDWEAWLGEFKGEIDCEFRDMVINAGDDVAFVSTLSRVFEKQTEGSGHWVRVTVGLRKTGGRWLAIHEHVSIPAGPMGTPGGEQ
jgi:ketosteroid isomerase-like protein